jgi:hypothetical protein
MIISTDSSLFFPTFEPDKVNILEAQMNQINLRMISLKRRWAQSVMHYNLTSKQAFTHRFVALPIKDGRQTDDGLEFETMTAEERVGTYVCSPIVKSKVDNYLMDFQSRQFNCDVSSIARDNDTFLVKYLQDQTFDTPQFKNAKDAAFKDALLKGTGYIRPRLYDIVKKQQRLDVSKNKVGKRIYKFKEEEISVNQGLSIEYVDAENVYVDPLTKNPQEMFISTPMMDLELIGLFPILRDYIRLDNSFNLTQVEKDIRENYAMTIEDPASYKGGAFGFRLQDSLPYITPRWMNNYQMGERFTDWYNRPEMMMDFTSGFAQPGSPSTPGNASMGDTEKTGWNFLSQGFENFNFLWDSLFFGETYNAIGLEYALRTKMYRLNEYYNWAEDRYVLFVDKYVLYDGPMLEPYKACPVVPIYFDWTQSDGFFGKSVNDHLHFIQVEANEKETLFKQSLEMASVTFLEVNRDRLLDPETPIRADILTTIYTKGTQDGEQPTQPAIQQIPVQNQSVQTSMEAAQKWTDTAEKLFPSLDQINLQISKDEREENIGSRFLRSDFFLKINAEQLTKFAYKIFALKLFELKYFNEGQLAIQIAPSKVRALIIRDNEEEIAQAKKQIMYLLQQNYQMQIDQVKQQIQQDPKMQQQIQQLHQLFSITVMQLIELCRMHS